MKELETEISDALERRAGTVGPRTMPHGTIGRIRRRQAMIASTAGVVLVAALTASITFLRTASAPNELGSGPSEPPRSVLEDVPAGWPAVDVHDPSTAYEPAPIEYHAVDEIIVVAAGTVAGHGFSLLAWTGSTEDDGTEAPCLIFAGPSPTEAEDGMGGPVVSTCADAHGVPQDMDLYLLGQQDAAVEGIGANLGFVSPRVRGLEIVLDDGTRSRIPLVPGSERWGGVRTFLFFPPPEAGGGTLLALDGDGAVLARARICVFEAGYGGSCAGLAEQVAPAEEGR